MPIALHRGHDPVPSHRGHASSRPFVNRHLYASLQPLVTITANARLFDVMQGVIQFTDGGVFLAMPAGQGKRRHTELKANPAHVSNQRRLRDARLQVDGPRLSIKKSLLRGIRCFQLDGEIGAAGFEPTTPTTPKWCATKLRYAPSDSSYHKASTALILLRMRARRRALSLSLDSPVYPQMRNSRES